MHFASQEWPQNIVKSLLSLGADLSIRDNKKKYALENIPESTILEVLDFHCMKSSFDLGKNGLSDKLITEKGRDDALNNEDNMEEEEEEEYQRLLSDYDPRHMTNIGRSPVEFDYEILAPNRYCKSKAQSYHGKLDSSISQIRNKEMSVLSTLAQSKYHHNIMKHPVVKSFIWLKWNRTHTFYNGKIRRDLILASLLSLYMMNQFDYI